MKKIILFVLLCISLLSFGQGNESISKKNIELKKYESEPIYFMDINSDYSYEILVNGFPISRHSYITGLYSVPLNYYIYWSGEQSIEIRIYPKIYENLNQEENLKDGYFNLQINQREWTKDNILSEPKIIYSYDFPLEENAEKKMFVHKATFQADVPYQLTDWRNGRTFKEEDSVILKEKVLKYYEKLKYSFENQDGEGYMQTMDTGFFNAMQSNYQTMKEFNDYYNNKKDFINKKERKLEPIENYKLQISGGGKLLSLRRTDGFNAGEGVLRRWYTKNGRKLLKIEDIVLYSPQGSDDDYNFEVIWYMNFGKGANQ